MDILSVVTVICCVVNLVLLAAVLIVMLTRDSGRKTKSALRSQTQAMKELYDSGNRTVLDQLGRQNGEISSAVKMNVELLGGRLESEQKGFRQSAEASLAAMDVKLSAVQRDNREGLDSIRTIVSDRLREILAESNAAVIHSISELSRSISETQDMQLRTMTDRLQKLEADLGQIRTDMTAALADIGRANSESLNKLMTENRESLDRISGTVNEKLQESLDKRINESFRTVSEQLMSVSKGLGEMQSVASDVSGLKQVLTRVKTRGIFGEVQLEAILEDILLPGQYKKQFRIKEGSDEKVDFAVKLPGAEGSDEVVYLPIDSKFPGDSYAALAEAVDSGDSAAADDRRKKLYAAIKEEAKSISSKYIDPPHTTDLAFMFLPSEGLYSEAVGSTGLVDELRQRYHVNIAGPSTMAALLSSFRMGFQTIRIRQKSAEIQKILEAAKKEFGTFGEALQRTRERLRRVDSDLENLVVTRSNAINRALRGITETGSLTAAREILGSGDGNGE